MTRNTLLILPLCVFLLNACSSAPNQNNSSPNSKGSVTSKLYAMNWKLIGIQNGSKVLQSDISGVSLKRYQLTFTKSNVRLQGGCNLASGRTQLGKGNIKISPMISTKKACQQPLMRSDNELSRMLQGMRYYRFSDNNTLILGGYDGGKSLLLRGTPSKESKYSGNVVRKFIQMRNTLQGLVWREVKYNSKYIQINKNEAWNTAPFPGIEGFTPRQNQEYIVRVNEVYDAQLGKKVWIKDMVVMRGRL